jgi:Na+/proline symporter
MSTAEALLIVAGSALSEDIFQTFFERSASPRRRLIVGRIGVFVVGVAPLLFVLTGTGKGELIQLIVLLFSALMAASFFAPVIGGIFWRRATREGAIAAMLGGVAAAGAWKLWGAEAIDPVLPGFAVSVAAYVIVSLLTPPPPASALAPYFPGERAGEGSEELEVAGRV